MLLASVDGAIGPAEEARIPVTDDGLLRGDGAFEVMRLYAGRPFALEDHLARLARSCAGLRLEPDLGGAAGRGRRAARARRPGRRAAAARAARAAAAGSRSSSRCRAPAAVARVATVRYAPNRVLDGLKTLSYAGNMLATRLAKEGGFDEALLVTPARPRARGPDVVVLLGPRRRAADAAAGGPDPGLDHPRAVIAETGAVEEPCTLEDLQAADEAFIASTVREVLPIAAIDDLQLPAAPGPVTLGTREALVRADRAGAGCAGLAAPAGFAAALVVHVPDDVQGGGTMPRRRPMTPYYPATRAQETPACARMTGTADPRRRRRSRLLGPEPGPQLRRHRRLRAGVVLRRLRQRARALGAGLPRDPLHRRRRRAAGRPRPRRRRARHARPDPRAAGRARARSRQALLRGEAAGVHGRGGRARGRRRRGRRPDPDGRPPARLPPRRREAEGDRRLRRARRHPLHLLAPPQPRPAAQRRERAVVARRARRLGGAAPRGRGPPPGRGARRGLHAPGVEDVVFAFLRFPSGVAAHLHLSWLDPHKTRSFTIVGSRKMATFDDMELERKVTVYDKGFDEVTHSYGEYITRSGDIHSPRIAQPRAAADRVRALRRVHPRGPPAALGRRGGPARRARAWPLLQEAAATLSAARYVLGPREVLRTAIRPERPAIRSRATRPRRRPARAASRPTIRSAPRPPAHWQLSGWWRRVGALADRRHRRSASARWCCSWCSARSSAAAS